ncbi:MAG: GntR family transcriptional regulator [Rhodospirillaceae bacterium]
MDTSAQTAIDKIGHRRSQTLNSIVREAIEQMIVSGELSSGERINESGLAAKLEVSRGPVREACRGLEQAGLLVSEVNHGVYVRKMTLEEARDLYEVRGALSGLVGRLIVQKAKQKQVNELTDLVDKMDKVAEDQDFQAYYQLNIQFHDALVQAADNPALEKTYHWIIKQLHLFRRMGLVQKGNMKISNAEHRAIVDAITARDENAAETAMRQHVSGGWARMSASV